jgi:hypothetical protein
MDTEQDKFDDQLMRRVSQSVFATIGQFLPPDTEWSDTKPIIAGIVDALARAIAMPISMLPASKQQPTMNLVLEIVGDNLRDSVPGYVEVVRKETRRMTQ